MGKKEDKPVVFKGDKRQEKAMRKAAEETARKAGKEVETTKEGVGRDPKESAKQARERQAREKINKLSARGQAEDPQWQGVPPVNRRGSTGGRWD